MTPVITSEPAWTIWGFTPSDVATVAGAVLAALIAAFVVVIGYRREKEQSRRDTRTAIYAEAMRAVEDYLEAPYLVIRRDGSSQARMTLMRHISEIQSRIAFHQAWIRVHGTPDVCTAYEQYVRSARAEAGAAMTKAWKSQPTRRDRDVPVSQRLPRERADLARDLALAAMQRDTAK